MSASSAGRLAAGVAEPELVEPGLAADRAVGDAVELVFHAGGEGVVDQLAEVLLEQADHREGGPGGHQRGALLPDVAAVLDGLHDRRVGGGAADAELLEPLDQRGLGEAGGRRGGVALGLELGRRERLADGEHGQQRLAVVEGGIGIVGALHVGPQVAGERDGPTGGGELGVSPVGRRGTDAHLDRLAPGVDHLRGDGALPDELVEAELVGAQLAPAATRACGTTRRRGGWPRGPPGRS